MPKVPNLQNIQTKVVKKEEKESIPNNKVDDKMDFLRLSNIKKMPDTSRNESLNVPQNLKVKKLTIK